MAPSAWAEMTSAGEAASPQETGGILLGYRTNKNIVVVGIAEVPDPNATRTSYTMQTTNAQTLLDEARHHFPQGSPVGYIGDWHTHPAPSPPSHTDRRSHSLLSRHYRKPMAGVVAVHTPHGWQPYGHVTSRWRLQRCEVATSNEEALS